MSNQFTDTDLKREVWKDVQGYKGYYQVSNMGRVRSLDRWIPRMDVLNFRLMKGRILKSTYVGNGYPQVNLSKKGKVKICDIHRLVLEAFVGTCPDSMECRHIDGDKSNAKLSNIKWGTPVQNQKDRNKHGTCNSGDRNGHAKLSWEKVLWIRRKYATGKYTQMYLARKVRISPSVVSLIVNMKAWREY